jgi:hypothetical protein
MSHYKTPDNSQPSGFSLHYLDDGVDPVGIPSFPSNAIAITDAEAEVIRAANTPAPTPPTPLEQIRALEQQYADAQAKLTRQSLLALALDKAMTDPAAAGLERAQVHAFLLAGDNGYAALWNLEQQVEALRAQL